VSPSEVERTKTTYKTGSGPEVEKRAERVVEIEGELREQISQSNTEIQPDHRFHFQRQQNIRNARIVDIKKECNSHRNNILLNATVDNETLTYSIPWPVNPLDEETVLKRLCDANGTSVE